jgi:hypothetical protein
VESLSAGFSQVLNLNGKLGLELAHVGFCGANEGPGLRLCLRIPIAGPIKCTQIADKDNLLQGRNFPPAAKAVLS